MTDNEILNTVDQPPEDLAMVMRIALDRMMHDYTHEERMFWAMQYALGEFNRANTKGRDLTDYRIAADELANIVADNHEQ